MVAVVTSALDEVWVGDGVRFVEKHREQKQKKAQ